jgi:hypothetical protein
MPQEHGWRDGEVDGGEGCDFGVVGLVSMAARGKERREGGCGGATEGSY